MADVNASFVKQVLDSSQLKWKPDIQHNGQSDDFPAGFEILERGTFCHPGRVEWQVTSLKSGCSDTTVEPVVQNMFIQRIAIGVRQIIRSTGIMHMAMTADICTGRRLAFSCARSSRSDRISVENLFSAVETLVPN